MLCSLNASSLQTLYSGRQKIHEWTCGVPLQCHSQGAAYLLSPLLHLEEHTFNSWSPLLLLWPSPSSSHPCLSAASSSSLSSWITVNWLLSDLWLVRPRLCDQLPLVLLVPDCHKFLLCRLARICRIAERGGSVWDACYWRSVSSGG